MHARAVGGDDAQERAGRARPRGAARGGGSTSWSVERRVLREAARPLEADPRLLADAAARYTSAPGTVSEVVQRELAASVVLPLPRGRSATISRAGPKYARAIRRWYGSQRLADQRRRTRRGRPSIAAHWL